jgi:hypothetical protein
VDAIKLNETESQRTSFRFSRVKLLQGGSSGIKAHDLTSTFFYGCALLNFLIDFPAPEAPANALQSVFGR